MCVASLPQSRHPFSSTSHWHRRRRPEPAGAGNGGLAGSFVSVVFSIVIGCRAVPDLYRSASKLPFEVVAYMLG
jgi:hypothetical protein